MAFGGAYLVVEMKRSAFFICIVFFAFSVTADATVVYFNIWHDVCMTL